MNFSKALLLALLTVMTSPAVWAHGDSASTKTAQTTPSDSEETTFGKPGNAKKVMRTITVDMNDTMRFTPDKLAIRQGDTVRFVVKNSGKIMHEFVLGTMTELKNHAEMMKKHPGMEHDEPYMAHVAPGKTQTLVWQFTKAGAFQFGCLLPGHLEAGMAGTINVTKR